MTTLTDELAGLADRLARLSSDLEKIDPDGSSAGYTLLGDAGQNADNIAADIRALAARLPDGWVMVPREPTEAQWSGLARDVVLWMQAYQRHDSDSLLKHLDRSGTEIPAWLRKEADTGSHSLPKGSIAAIIYKAMLAAAPAPE